MSGKLVLVRHGQSEWNVANLFTGWHDVDLSDLGREEARQAGRELKATGIRFDYAYTSMLKRAIRTLWIALDEMDRMWLPVEKSWRLNERHYGALQGLDKAQTVEKHGAAQVLIWRRSYDVPPPGGESLKDTAERVLPYYKNKIWPDLLAGKTVLVVAHGNSLRALVKYFDNVSDEDIVGLNIPTGIPLVYELDDALKPLRHYYLGDPEAVAKAALAVANQGKAR